MKCEDVIDQLTTELNTAQDELTRAYEKITIQEVSVGNLKEKLTYAQQEVSVHLLAHLWCAYAIPLFLSWIVRCAVCSVCVDHNYPKVWMD